MICRYLDPIIKTKHVSLNPMVELERVAVRSFVCEMGKSY